MEIKDIKSFLEYTAKERKIIDTFKIPTDSFLPMLLSMKAGGSWSFSTGQITTISVKDVTTYYDEEQKIGYSHEKIYLFVNPEIVKQEGLVHRLEKCSRIGERILVERPYRITLKAERIILAQINPMLKKISIHELEEKHVELTGSPAYGAAHEMEHLIKGEIEGMPPWDFEFQY